MKLLKLKAASLALVCLLSAASSYAQNPKTQYQTLFTITVDPIVFRRDVPIAVTASFTNTTVFSPSVCMNQRFSVRVYDLGMLDGEPIFSGDTRTQFLTESGGPDPVPAANTLVKTTFAPFSLPADAGEKLYMVVLVSCETRIKTKEVGPLGETIYKTSTGSMRIGGATFHYECPNRRTVCGYRAD